MELQESVLKIIEKYPDALTTVANFRLIHKHSFMALSLEISEVVGIVLTHEELYNFLIEQSKRFSMDGAASSDSRYSTIREGSNGWQWLSELVIEKNKKGVD